VLGGSRSAHGAVGDDAHGLVVPLGVEVVIAFLSTPEVEWLYSGVTKTNPSKRAMVAAQFWVCAFWY